MPAAIPVPAPFHHRLRPVSGCVRSHRISAIRAMLIWPKYNVRSTGSVHSTAAR